MPEKLIVETCSPVLAGLKTANLFNCPYQSERELLHDIADLNDRLSEKGLHVMVLSSPSSGRALIYLFRPDRLDVDLKDPEVQSILRAKGYDTTCVGSCLTGLIHHLHDDTSFPHEIGCFLGYPVEDVRGFMENRPCIFYGIWKVYGNPEEKKKLFHTYDSCTKSYLQAYEKGMTLESLTAGKSSS